MQYLDNYFNNTDTYEKIKLIHYNYYNYKIRFKLDDNKNEKLTLINKKTKEHIDANSCLIYVNGDCYNSPHHKKNSIVNKDIVYNKFNTIDIFGWEKNDFPNNLKDHVYEIFKSPNDYHIYDNKTQVKLYKKEKFIVNALGQVGLLKTDSVFDNNNLLFVNNKLVRYLILENNFVQIVNDPNIFTTFNKIHFRNADIRSVFVYNKEE